MKKVTFCLVIATISTFLLPSCKKEEKKEQLREYICTCTFNKESVVKRNLGLQTRENAEKACQSLYNAPEGVEMECSLEE